MTKTAMAGVLGAAMIAAIGFNTAARADDNDNGNFRQCGKPPAGTMVVGELKGWQNLPFQTNPKKGPVGAAGQFTIKADGTLTGQFTLNADGQVLAGTKGNTTGQFTLNNDCTGTLTLRFTGFKDAKTFEFYVDSNGKLYGVSNYQCASSCDELTFIAQAMLPPRDHDRD